MKSPLLRIAALLLTACVILVAQARADLVWSPRTGWQVQGGALSGLTGAEGRNALQMMNKARAAEEAGSLHSALKTYAKVAKSYPSSIYAPEAFFHIGKIRLGRREYYNSFEAFQQIIARYPNERRFNEVIQYQYEIAEALLNGSRNRVWGWLPTFKNREKAVNYFATIVSNAPYSDYAPLALMAVARGEQYLGAPDDAIDALDHLTNTYQQSVLAPDAYLNLAKLHSGLVAGPYYDQGETKNAITYYEDFMILFPGDPKIADAAQGLDRMKTVLADSKIKIGDFYFYKRDNYTAARVYYNEAITSYPDSAAAHLAKERLAAVEAKAAHLVTPSAPAPEKKKHFFFF